MIDRLSRRNLLAVAAASSVAGCAGFRNSSAFWTTVTGTRPHESPATTREYADKLPYASMLFWFDGQAKSLIVLATVDPGDRLTWLSAEKRSITTYGPFVVATAGTDVELRETIFGPGWSPDIRKLVGKSLERTTKVAWKSEATVHLRSRFHRAGTETVKILDQKLQLARIDEVVVANGRTRLLNSYWIDDATGECHRSHQAVLPTMQPLNIEILKFAATT